MRRWNLRRPFKGAKGAPGDGAPGPQGDNAYEVAVSNGFVGTEPEWLASLEGEDGADGTPGTDGMDGINGLNGAAATISVNSTSTGSPGTSASVTNVGTSNAASLNFVIPRGDPGPAGPSKRMVIATVTTNASGVASLTYSPAFAATPNVHCELTVPGNNRQAVRLTASTAAGCSIIVEQRNAVFLSLLGIDILGAGVTVVNGASVRITAIET